MQSLQAAESRSKSETETKGKYHRLKAIVLAWVMSNFSARTTSNPLMAFFANQLSTATSGAGIIVAVVGLVAVGIVLEIGYVILANVQNNVPSSNLSSAQNSNLSSIANQATNGFLLAGIVVLVLAAVIIIGVLMRGFMTGRE